MMRHFILAALCMALFLPLTISAQKVAIHYTEARDLTLVGNLFPDTPNPYHRLDTARYKGLERSDYSYSLQSSGLSVAFRTDSPQIWIQTDYVYRRNGTISSRYALQGYDLYIKQNGKWLWAAAGVSDEKAPDKPFTLIRGMDGKMHECLLYFPLFSEVRSVKIGVKKGREITPMENPFRHRVGIFGSSFTHGSGTTRSGMTYPAIFSRDTGIQLLSLGVNGRARLQPGFARALADADVDAYLFDAFSNPSIEQIEERLFPFIETIQAKHPDIPLIFLRTIYREGRNFNMSMRKFEEERLAVADSLMGIACRKYRNVYYVKSTDAASKEHDTSVDGTHPSDFGYYFWARSIEKPVLRILRKYDIR